MLSIQSVTTSTPVPPAPSFVSRNSPTVRSSLLAMQRRTLATAIAALALVSIATPLTLRVLRADSSSSPTAGSAATPPAPAVTVAAGEQRTLVESEDLTGRVDAGDSVDLRE